MTDTDLKRTLTLGSEPAAPCTESAGPAKTQHLGLTKREYFAGLAMQGLVSIIGQELDDEDLRTFSRCCVRLADFLLLELAR